MSLPSQKYQDELPKLKKLVENTALYFRNCYKRFNDFRKFVYDTQLTKEDKDTNGLVNRPNLEANVITAYESRLCGEFSKQEPDIECSADEGAQIDPAVIEVVEGHFRHIMEEAKSANTQYTTYRDGLSGGFSNLKVFTEYANPMSFNQVIKFRKGKYPILTGFDPLATEPHKGDGQYCFECYPMTKADFKREYEDIDIDKIYYHSATEQEFEGFHFAYNNGKEDILLLCNLWKKKKKKIKIHDVAGHGVMTDEDYQKLVQQFQDEQRIEPLPAIANSRWTETVKICRYIMMENTVLRYEETDFDELPIVFVDGDSIDLYDDRVGSVQQFTRPYAYNAMGAQKLKNLGVQCLAAYLNMMTQHKYIVKKEALPQEKSYLENLTKVQIASLLVVNAFKDNDPNSPIPEPIIPVQPHGLPPEVSNTITMADQIIQNELGSYDAALGINNNQLSGLAIVEAATQSNAAAMPYVVNYIAALNQVAKIIIKLMPKYYKTPMSIPVIDKEGNRSAVKINQPGGLDFNYDSNMLQVKVTAGVNFAIQKSKALNQIIMAMQANPGFAQFMNAKGLKVFLDNFEVRGSDQLKTLADQYMQEQAQMQQQQQQMQMQMMQNDPKHRDSQTKQFTAQADAQFKARQLQLQEQELSMRLQESEAERDAALARAQAEEVRANADLHMSSMEMQHRHGKDTLEFLHKVEQGHKQEQREKEQQERENATKEE